MKIRIIRPVVQTVLAAGIVYFLYSAPELLLLPAIPWLPSYIDAAFLISAVQLSLFLCTALILGVPLLAACRIGASAAGVRAVFWLLSGEVLLALLVAVTIISTSDAVGFRVADGLQALARDFPVSGSVGGALRVFVLGPVFEELLFRALILGWVFRTSPPWFGLAVTTALFASLHSSFLLSGIGGLVYGLLYLRYRSVLLCILAHAGSNTFAAHGVPMLIAHLHETGVIGPIRGNLLLIQLTWFLAVVACFWMFVRCLRDKGGTVKPHSNDPVRDPCAASSSPPATPASSASSGTCSRPSAGTSSRNPN